MTLPLTTHALDGVSARVVSAALDPPAPNAMTTTQTVDTGTTRRMPVRATLVHVILDGAQRDADNCNASSTITHPYCIVRSSRGRSRRPTSGVSIWTRRALLCRSATPQSIHRRRDRSGRGSGDTRSRRAEGKRGTADGEYQQRRPHAVDGRRGRDNVNGVRGSSRTQSVGSVSAAHTGGRRILNYPSFADS